MLRDAPDGASAQVHPIYARLLRMLLQQAAVDGDRVLAAAGLAWPALLGDDRHLGRDTVERLTEAAVAATGRPWLGLDLGGQTPVSAHGALGYAAVTAPDLRGCLEVLARYGPVRNEAMGWSVHPLADGLVLQAVDRADWGAARGFVIDTVIAAMLRIVETALGERPAGLRVDLPGPAPAWAAEYRRFAPVTLRFGQPALAFTATGAALARPCLGADARAHAAACRECEAALAAQAGVRPAQQVAELFAAAPPGGFPGLAAAAAHCGLSPRTLMRRLAADGTSFQALLDAARMDRALWLLQHTALPVEEIAARLGYLDTSNFSRTARRWFGRAPRALRGGGPGNKN